jgi:cobalt-zinc-cadmium efflux system protein
MFLTNLAHHHALPIASKLKFGIMLTSFILVVEVAGGLLSNSLALLADAGHLFTDVIALTLSWYGVKQAERPASHSMTFGYHRIGVLIAVVNAISIFVIAAVIFYEAFQRFGQPPEVNSLLMLTVAMVGLVVNLFVVFWLRKEQRGNLNVRSAFWHALGDALASIGVILGGIIILLTGWFVVDPIISAFIGLIIILAAWRILKEGLRVLLEATPPEINVKKLLKTLSHVPGVRAVHDIHVWSISPQLHTMSCHVLIDDLPTSEAAAIRQKIEVMLRQQYDIEHSTIQMECEQCSANDILCRLSIGKREDDEKVPPQS